MTMLPSKKIIFKNFGLLLVILCTVSCKQSVETGQFDSYGSLVEFFDRAACKNQQKELVVYNYDRTEYFPQVLNPCEFNIDNYDRRNLCYLSTADRKDGINIHKDTKVVKAKMESFINNMGAHPSLSTNPAEAKFILELNPDYPRKQADHLLMALSVVYEEVLHFNYRKKMRGIPIILSSKVLYDAEE